MNSATVSFLIPRVTATCAPQMAALITRNAWLSDGPHALPVTESASALTSAKVDLLGSGANRREGSVKVVSPPIW